MKHYSELCEQVHAQLTPTSESLLCRFVTYLANQNISHSTIKVYLAGVRQLHVKRREHMPLFNSMPCLNQVLRGIKIRQSKSSTTNHQPRLPITPEALLRIKNTWEREGLDNDKVMLWAAFTTCFFGFLRSGEVGLETNGAFDPTRDLTPQDVEVDNLDHPKLLKLHLKHSKTDPYSEGSDIFIARTNDELCPVAALLSWLTQRNGDQRGPLFCFKSGAPLTRSTLVIRLKRALSAAGIDPTRFAGHSFRIGAATTAAKKGVADSTIKRLGRWKSAAYLRYIKLSPATLATAASSISNTRRVRPGHPSHQTAALE